MESNSVKVKFCLFSMSKWTICHLAWQNLYHVIKGTFTSIKSSRFINTQTNLSFSSSFNLSRIQVTVFKLKMQILKTQRITYSFIYILKNNNIKYRLWQRLRTCLTQTYYLLLKKKFRFRTRHLLDWTYNLNSIQVRKKMHHSPLETPP